MNIRIIRKNHAADSEIVSNNIDFEAVWPGRHRGSKGTLNFCDQTKDHSGSSIKFKALKISFFKSGRESEKCQGGANMCETLRFSRVR